MKRIWSFSLFIFFFYFYMLQYGVVKNVINKRRKPNMRNDPPLDGNSPDGGKNNAGVNNGGGDNNSKNNPNEQNGNINKKGKTKEDEVDLPVQAQNESDKNQIEKIADEAELLAEEAKMLADLASKMSQKVEQILGTLSQERVPTRSELELVLETDPELKMEVFHTADDVIRAKDDVIKAALEAREAETVIDANEALDKAKKAKTLAENLAQKVKTNAIKALKAKSKDSEVSEVEKIKIPIPEASKPKKVLKKQEEKKQPPAAVAKPEATPPTKEATPVKKAPEMPKKEAAKADAAKADAAKAGAAKAGAAPAAPEPAAASKVAKEAIVESAENKPDSLYKEKNIKEGTAEAENNQEQRHDPESESLLQKQINVFYNLVQFFISKIKAIFKIFLFW
uniref:Merozoite surface protein 3 n=1 Tax=Plasmodium cynomolgi TaxID=5827 RepID=X2CM44_9APIC|nr:merozoite surface protein 3 [Plasmodium cynomolgi]